MRRMPAPVAVSDWAAVTTRTLSAARPGSGSRPASRLAGSSSTPFSVARRTSAAQSTNVLAPGSAQLNAMVEVDSTVSPSKRPRRSTAMS